MLSDIQLESFNNNGFLVIEDFIDNNKCQLLINRAKQLIDGFDPSSIVPNPQAATANGTATN